MKKETMNLMEHREGYKGGFGERNGEEEMLQSYY